MALLKGLTVLLTCKDRERNLAYCLGSIHGCNPRPRVILTDFGSKESLEHYAEKYKWLTVIRVIRDTEFFHKTRAYNIALKQVTSPYICATDTDQIFEPNFFGEVHKVLKNNTKAFVMCRTYFWKKSIPK